MLWSRFIGGKSARTGQTLTTAPDGSSFLGWPGIDDSGEIEKLIGEVGKPEPLKKVKKPKRRAAPKPKPKRKKRAPVRKKIVARKPKKVAASAKKAKKLTATAEVLKVIKGHKTGVNIPKLKKITGFADTKIRAIIHRASKEGKIKRLSRGVYVSA